MAAQENIEEQKIEEAEVEAEEEKKVSFEDLNLPVGTRMQLITYGVKKRESYSSLIGFEPGRFLFIRMPQEGGFNLPVKIAERVDIRIFTGVSIYTFSSVIEYIYQTPRNFVELAYPTNIRVIPLRKDVRINTRMPVRIWHMHGEKLEAPRITTALDLSITGIMLQGNFAMGDVGDEIGVSFSIHNAVTDENTLIEAMATIRNCREETDENGNALYKHGALFNELRPFHRATLQNFINDHILLGRQSALS